MRRLCGVLAAGLFGVAAHASAAGLSVVFTQPEKFVDAGYTSSLPSEQDRAEVLRDIEQHLQQLALLGLPAGDTLEIEVLDVDLAGRVENLRLRTGTEVRIVRDTTFPRITLRYTLRRGSLVLAEANEELTDLNFLRSRTRHLDGDRLRYEKAMLSTWFEQRISRR
jgi:Protein of unknown function (DUF3016)